MKTLIGMAAVAVPMTMAVSGDFSAGLLAVSGAVAGGLLDDQRLALALGSRTGGRGLAPADVPGDHRGTRQRIDPCRPEEPR